MTSEGIILHVWPGQWDLPSFEPLCLAAVLYLQLAIPGHFHVAETVNPDQSPNGQLPYLVHDQHVVTSLPSIIKYVSDLRSADYSKYPNANLDFHLSPTQKSQRTAWFAHTESQLGNLVAHALFSVRSNWEGMTGPTLASMYPVPQRYYVPRRIRNDYYPRLHAAGLWAERLEPHENPVDKPSQKETNPSLRTGIKKNATISEAFERQKVLAKVRAELDIYQSLLLDKSYIFQEGLTSLDVLIAAHFLLLTKPPYPDTSLKSLLLESYPSLSSYADRVYDLAFAIGTVDIKLASMSFSFRDLFPTWPSRTKKRSSPEEAHFNRMRWAFFGLVAGAFAAYLAVVTNDLEIKWVAEDEEVDKN